MPSPSHPGVPQAASAPPNGQVLALLAALSNPSADHNLHVQAIKARDDALSASPESYGNLCQNFARILACPNIEAIPSSELETLNTADPTSMMQLKHDPTSWVQFRQMAGLLLKNALVSPPIVGPVDAAGRPANRIRLPTESAMEIKSVLLGCIADSNAVIRGAASSTIASASVNADVEGAEPLPLREWPELTPFLVHCLDQSIPGGGGTRSGEHAMDGALLTLRKLLEDSPSQFEKESGAQFDSLLPLLLRLLESKDEKPRKESLKCLNCMIVTMPGSLVIHMDDYLAGLSSLATDSSAGVRRLVCQAIVSFLSIRTEYLHPHIQSISQFMLNSTSDAEPTVALEACEFWLTFASLDEDVCTPEMVDSVRALLPQLVPVLLRGMVYPQDKREELLEQNSQDEAEGAARGNESVAPVFHKSRAKRVDKDNEDSDSDADDDEEDDDERNEWSIRKCSAASLDTLAGLYGPQEVLPSLLPALQEGLSHADPWVREASVLALGAIAEGCVDAMAAHMAQLHPYLMTQLSTPNSLPQLKSISAWTLGRYASWAVDQVHSGAQPDLIGRMTEALMAQALDKNRKVQIASCSSFGVLVESTGDLMAQYLEPVYQTLMQALMMYQTRSLMILFDTLGVMADFIGPAIGEGSLPGIYIPSLLQMWDRLAKQNPFDKTLLPLMESLASIALVIGMNYQPWALETFNDAMCTIESCTMILSASAGDIEDEEADSIVCAADLIDGLVEGLGANFATLVSSSAQYGEHFLSVLHGLTGHEVAGVRMSAFAIVGDLARQAPALIEAGLPQLLTEAVSCIDPMYPSVCNNAVWAIGEVCVRCGDNPTPLQPFSEGIVQNLISLLMGNAVDSSGRVVSIPGLAENAATTMGRLAKVDANFVARDLPRFLMGWCDGMAKISDSTERRDAFEGFILSIRANPQSIQTASKNVGDAVTGILFAVVSWHLPTDMSADLFDGQYNFRPFPPENAELGTALVKLLHDLKTSLGDETWGEVQSQMPVNVRRLMREAYQL